MLSRTPCWTRVLIILALSRKPASSARLSVAVSVDLVLAAKLITKQCCIYYLFVFCRLHRFIILTESCLLFHLGVVVRLRCEHLIVLVRIQVAFIMMCMFWFQMESNFIGVTMERSLCFGNPLAEGRFNPHSPIIQTSFSYGTPSPGDSGVMSPMTPLDSWPGSTPEHLTNGFQSSPCRVQSGLEEVHSPFQTTSPLSSNEDERNFCAQNYVVSDPWLQHKPLDVVGKN